MRSMEFRLVNEKIRVAASTIVPKIIRKMPV